MKKKRKEKVNNVFRGIWWFMIPPFSQGFSSWGLLHSLSYGSLRSPMSRFSSLSSSKYFLSSLILCWSSSSSSSFYSSIFPPLYSTLFSFILFKNGFLLYLENGFFFHHLQFSSIFFQYSRSYFLLPIRWWGIFLKAINDRGWICVFVMGV